MKYQVRKAWCYPEQTRVVRGENGRDYVERIPDHPSRLAYPSDWNFWWEEIDETTYIELSLAGAIVRAV